MLCTSSLLGPEMKNRRGLLLSRTHTRTHTHTHTHTRTRTHTHTHTHQNERERERESAFAQPDQLGYQKVGIIYFLS